MIERVPIRHRLLAVLVAAIWGINFIAIDASLDQFPPFFLAALRWTLIAVPTVLFVPRPKVALRWLIGYGVGFGILQFLFLYWGLSAGMPAGLASLVLQSSAPFTVVLGGVFLGERLSRVRGLGVVIAVAGLVIVGSQRAGGAGLGPFVLTVLGGLGWAFGNLASRQARPDSPLRLTLWMTVVPPVPMGLLALAVEGPHRIAASFHHLGTSTGVWAIVGLGYTCAVATVVGSGIWTWLLSRHPSSVVAPYSMLVPVVGLTAAWLMLHERPTLVELLGSAVVVVGVFVTSTGRLTLRGYSVRSAWKRSSRRSPAPVSSARTVPSGCQPAEARKSCVT